MDTSAPNIPHRESFVRDRIGMRAVAGECGRGSRGWGVRLGGVMGAVALHLLFLSALGLGASAGKPSRTRAGIADMQLARMDEGAVSAMLVIDLSVPSTNRSLSAPPWLAPIPKLEAIRVARLIPLSVPALARPGDAGSQTQIAASAAAVEGPERARLFGRYVNQIVARVERAWTRPDTAPSGMANWSAPKPSRMTSRSTTPVHPAAPLLFKCRVQILQSRAGQVLEVTLLDCGSSPEWQQSLVNAIDAASPLPAPADASVFAPSLILNFTSTASARDPVSASVALRTASTGAMP